jgi:ABC-2 type transport system ATP-binding protein
LIRVKNIKKNFGRIRAVKGLSFEIKKGEVVGLLGPNGAGKTTTMRMLVGYLYPDKGEILIDKKKIVEEAASIRRKIGYMPENNPIYKDMLVEELLEFVLSLHGIKKSRWNKKIRKIVKQVGIKEVFYRPIGELSKGYQQRVGIAQALIHDPKIIILDEPTEGLDPNQRKEIRKLIKEIGKTKTVILSTHVMQEARAMCDRLVIINKGKLVAKGTPEDLGQEKTNKVLITLKGKNLKKELKAIKNVEKIKYIEEKSKGSKKSYAIYFDGKDDFFEKLMEESHKNKWIIYQLNKEELSLEDVFYKVTK